MLLSYNGYLVTHEGYFYLLDSLPLLCAISLFVIVWPPLVLNGLPSDSWKDGEVATAMEIGPLKSPDSWKGQYA